MFKIRPDQMETLNQQALQDFEDRAHRHVRDYLPTQYRQQGGEKPIRALIQLGVKQAKRYGAVAACDVCKYIDLMVVLGRYFDADPAYPWARQILADETLDISERMDALIARGKEAQDAGEVVPSPPAAEGTATRKEDA